MNSVLQLKTVKKNVARIVEAEIGQTGGLLRLAPCWVPRSFLQPGKRLKLHPDDLYAFGLNRGGIDERWFASTTPAANENRTPDEGLSYVVVEKQRFTLKQAVDEAGATLIGEKIWNKYRKWPVYSKFFDIFCWRPLLGNCFRARRTEDRENADRRRGVRGSAN
jgi:hypothetical protein